MPQPGTRVGMARERVLQVAERLFMERGYTGVSMREIADALGIKQPALYYHAPEGKHQLYLAVLERALERHRAELHTRIAASDADLRAQLRVVVRWLLHSVPFNMARMAQIDIPALPAATAATASMLVWEALYLPIAQLFANAQARHEIRALDPTMLAGAAVALIDSLRAYDVPEEYTGPPELIGDQLIDMLLDGVLIGTGVVCGKTAATNHPIFLPKQNALS
ncbi:TetR/AcrR family transcriptional regulator, partial [Candidatus Gracilibacteria bacterium]|nr:TetR/AcrR family transcriptional regulator [Candidatus Gracilibacteria bacterium]